MRRRNGRQGWRATGGLVIGTAALLALPGVPADAARGDLDATFGDDGRALTGVVSQYHTGYDVALDPATGRVYVSGVGEGNGLTQPYIAAFTAAGVLDTSFGDSGIAFTGVASAADDYFYAGTAIALAPDGSRVYITGAAGDVTAGDADFAGETFVAAFTAAGELDATFSSDGFAGTGLDASPAGGTAMDVDPDSGRIFVAANTMTDPGAYEAESYLAAFDTAGNLDVAFGAGGIYDADLDTGFRGSVGLTIDPAAGRLYFVTATVGEPGLGVGTVRALDFSGALDPAFGTGGIADLGRPASVYPRFGVAVDAARDRLYVSSYEREAADNTYIVAFTASDGTIDTAFGDDGVTEGPLATGDYSGQPITVDPADGSIYLGTWSNAGIYPGHNYVAAFTVDGAADVSFGEADGRATTNTSSGGSSEHGVVVDAATRRLYYVHYASSGGGDTVELPVSTAVVTAFLLDAPEPPVVMDDVASTPHDQTLAVAAPGLLDNDTGAGDEPVSATPIVGGTTSEGGAVELAADGSYTYAPPAGFVGTDTFDYVAVGQAGGTATGSVTISVTNAAPTIADAPTYSTPYGEALDVPAPGVLGGASDYDGDPLTALPAAGGTGAGRNVTLALTGTSAGGTVDLDPDGAFRYLPPAGFSGVDTFTFTVSDGITSAGPFTAQVTVADPPPDSTTTPPTTTPPTTTTPTTSTTPPPSTTLPSTPPPTAPPVTTVPPPAAGPELPATGGGSLPIAAIGALLAVGGLTITLATRRWTVRNR